MGFRHDFPPCRVVGEMKHAERHEIYIEDSDTYEHWLAASAMY